jgi:hypothetical protein
MFVTNNCSSSGSLYKQLTVFYHASFMGIMIRIVSRLFPGVKGPGRGLDHPPPSSAEVKEGVRLYLFSPSGPSWPVLG